MLQKAILEWSSRAWEQGIAAHNRMLYQSLTKWIGMTPGDIDESDVESHDPEGRSNDMGGIQDWFANTREGYTLNGNSLPSYDTVMTS
ncbi:uncharacterized protein BDCG_16745 [Blastomyces dermatitidis ER-3]|uniref:Uncharacterized protein n=1 Tax=Ajellomyces dermatitidis (strain ER-3 / ATCC MYA-2586) TaxID=559297 RepID=A0ABX2VU49_AJEDR|nr:uncharacterized protein BDCG_16745 [Blastomyces dermatitidis ER-3]EQL33594.1 hypothetical protein BDFG_04346 [Blastomyces dermatitidis ATCC 26199]OAT00714.1 hypothetical protein BDCG_16745 [Blastomyces dermatitidis ER-3]